VHYKDLIPQFELKENGFLKHTNLNLGLFVFALGLFKKVILADTYSFWAKEGFDHHQTLHFFYAWGTALSYTLQLYFDFSGYSDMAIGLGLMFNINIPQNFNSPFKSRNVIEFWTRWHMTLSQFITSYIFTPLFRSFKKLNFRNSLISVFMTMMIAGIWHGAGWTFVAYGAMYGTALVVNHLMKKNKLTLPLPVAVFVTFIFTIFVFTMFRASTVGEAFNIYKGMLGLNGFQFPAGVIPKGILSSLGIKIGQHMNNDENFHLIMILLGVFVVFYLKNSQHHRSVFKPTTKMAWLTAFMFVLSLFGINRVSDFIYFNF
jgi:D-alanyl-lipoteichoic acid acyltransferase DltB (MBOAT superfamily)